jgi:hypothetical protein
MHYSDLLGCNVLATMWMVICKQFFTGILAVLFFLYFGYPSYSKYMDGETLISEEKVMFNPVNPPAITLVAWTAELMKGWKDVPMNASDLKSFCNTSASYSDFVQCVNNKTYALSDMVEMAKFGHDRNVTDSKYWNEDLSRVKAGKVFTLNNSYEVGSSAAKSLHIDFKKGFNYSIYIHDPQFFVITINPQTIPHIFLSLEDLASYIVYLVPIYHHMMDKPTEKCESSESYSFTACIKESMSKRIGCRLEWDAWSSKDITKCSTVDQLLKFEKEYNRIVGMDQWNVVNNTGCLTPCSYTEYKLAAEPLKSENTNPGLRLMLANGKVKSNQEGLAYPWVSFVAEFGGSLGLFLGFSFNTIWDGAEFLIFFSSKKITNFLSTM